jgi:hypothetical protein
MPEYYISDPVILVGINQEHPDCVEVGMLWSASRLPDTLLIPDIGTVKLPNISNNGSISIPNIKLNIIKNV